MAMSISWSGCPQNIPTEYIAMKFSTHIHGPPWMSPADFGDPLTFPVLLRVSTTIRKDRHEIWYGCPWSSEDES